MTTETFFFRQNFLKILIIGLKVQTFYLNSSLLLCLLSSSLPPVIMFHSSDGEITLLFVRHGQATQTSLRSVDYMYNPSLNEQGHEQAQRLSIALQERFKGSRSKFIIMSSPMRRALETAAPIALGEIGCLVGFIGA
jgi:hypothetical protein